MQYFLFDHSQQEINNQRQSISVWELMAESEYMYSWQYDRLGTKDEIIWWLAGT